MLGSLLPVLKPAALPAALTSLQAASAAALLCRLVLGLFWSASLGRGRFFTADGAGQLRLWASPAGQLGAGL